MSRVAVFAGLLLAGGCSAPPPSSSPVTVMGSATDGGAINQPTKQGRTRPPGPQGAQTMPVDGGTTLPNPTPSPSPADGGTPPTPCTDVTPDSGNWTWTLEQVPDAKDWIHGLWGTTFGNIYAVGRDGNIYRSSGDGTWTIVDSTRADVFVSVVGTSGQSVFVAGNSSNLMYPDSPRLFHSVDLGATWSNAYMADQSLVRLAVAGTEVFALGGHGLFRSVDDGMTWDEFAFQEGGPYASTPISFAVADALHLVVVGSAPGMPGQPQTVTAVDATGDGGQTWARTIVPDAELLAVWGADAASWWAAGMKNTIMRSADGGRTWALQCISGVNGSTLSAIWGAGAEELYVIGDGALVLHTSDGGDSWHTIALPSAAPWNLFSIWGRSPSEVFVGGESGTILHGTVTLP